MNSDKLKNNIKIILPQWLITLATVFLILIIILAVLVIGLEEIFAGRFYPGIKVANINLGGMTYVQAVKNFETRLKFLNNEGFTFAFEEQQANILPVAVSIQDPDLAYQIYELNFTHSLLEAFNYGRSSNIFKNFFERTRILLISFNLPIEIELDSIEMQKILSTNFDHLLKPMQETKIEFDGEHPSLVPGQTGEVFDYQKAIQKFKAQLSVLDFSPVILEKQILKPQISLTDEKNLLPFVDKVLTKDQFLLTATITRSWLRQPILKEWPVQKEEIKKGLELKWDIHKQKAYLGFNQQILNEILKPIKKEVEIDTRDAKFKISNNKVVEFHSSQDGIKIDFEKTLAELENNLIMSESNISHIYTTQIKAQILTGDVNDLGIQELVGVGKSNFSGSPKNRIHNIKIGAAAINGLVIKPGEEFSLNSALGEINAKTGYLPELVIKGNRTIPEYGGGLCQIGTTVFRLALDTGLKITERKPHAYRVIYYEPAGSDATIYAPHPDLKFINDTGNILLLQTKVDGFDLIFEFWGKSDGRYVEVGKPSIWNITSPGPTKYIETDELAVGEKKCIEHSVQGAEANLKRVISYTDGSQTEDNFYSKYRPWQEVCLVGVKKNATTSDEMISN